MLSSEFVFIVIIIAIFITTLFTLKFVTKSLTKSIESTKNPIEKVEKVKKVKKIKQGIISFFKKFKFKNVIMTIKQIFSFIKRKKAEKIEKKKENIFMKFLRFIKTFTKEWYDKIVEFKNTKKKHLVIIKFIWEKTGKLFVDTFRSEIPVQKDKDFRERLSIAIRSKNYNVSIFTLIKQLSMSVLLIALLFALYFQNKLFINPYMNEFIGLSLFGVNIPLITFYFIIGLKLKTFNLTGLFVNTATIFAQYLRIVFTLYIALDKLGIVSLIDKALSVLKTICDKLGITSLINKVWFILKVSMIIFILLVMEKMIELELLTKEILNKNRMKNS